MLIVNESGAERCLFVMRVVLKDVVIRIVQFKLKNSSI